MAGLLPDCSTAVVTVQQDHVIHEVHPKCQITEASPRSAAAFATGPRVQVAILKLPNQKEHKIWKSSRIAPANGPLHSGPSAGARQRIRNYGLSRQTRELI
jgi:hypothetical protein